MTQEGRPERCSLSMRAICYEGLVYDLKQGVDVSCDDGDEDELMGERKRKGETRSNLSRNVLCIFSLSTCQPRPTSDRALPV